MSASDTERYSVRTKDAPMAFTFMEFLRGAASAMVGVVVIAPLATTLAMVFLSTSEPWTASGTNVIGLIIFGSIFASVGLYMPWAFGALVVAGIPLGWLLGFMLRKVSKKAVHLTAFALLGALVGASTTLIAMDTSGASIRHSMGLAPLFVNTAVTALVVALCWSLAVKWALADDASTHDDGAVTTT